MHGKTAPLLPDEQSTSACPQRDARCHPPGTAPTPALSQPSPQGTLPTAPLLLQPHGPKGTKTLHHAAIPHPSPPYRLVLLPMGIPERQQEMMRPNSSHMGSPRPSPSLSAAARRVLDVNSGAEAAAINFALKHFRFELYSGKVQPVVSDSFSPAKVRAVLVRKCLLKPVPSPTFLLSAPHTLTLLQPKEMEKIPKCGVPLHRKHACI